MHNNVTDHFAHLIVSREKVNLEYKSTSDMVASTLPGILKPVMLEGAA